MANEDAAEKGHQRRFRDRSISTLVLTVIIAFAAVGTAWAGFQSAKWSGVQAIAYAKAGALRSESTRESTQAGQLRNVDVITFLEWLGAVNDERAEYPDRRLGTGYTPDPTTLSGVIYERFRPEFEPVVDAWIATRPLVTEGAPASPFAMPQYELAPERRANELIERADRLAAEAREANQRSDNYVLTGVLIALVLFFATLTGRADRGTASRTILFTLAVLALISAVVLLLTFPIKI